MIAGLLAPDAGEVLVGGAPLRGDTDDKKRMIGLVPQDLALYDELSARDNLEIFGALYDLTPAAIDRAGREALALVGLADRARDRVKSFSGGMKRRLNLAAALLHDPQLLILDEPTVGVDPQSRSAIFDNLEALRGRGKGILYTTHYMEEAERLCQRIVIVDHGAVVADDTLRGLERRVPPARQLTVEIEPGGEAPGWLPELRALAGVEAVELADHTLSVTLADLARASAVLAFLDARRQRFTHFRTERADLEDIFLQLTGRTLRDP
jgi:ABC-2 type transport system ATP-binding protein